MLRLALKVLAALVALVVAYVGVTFVQVLSAAGRDQARSVQAIVVMGAAQYDGRPSPVLRARLDHAAELYRRGLAAEVVVTGGKQVGDRVTEATVSATYLARHGVPDSAILREVKGRSSWQQLAAAAAFLRRRGVTTVLLVSDGFHNARIAAIASELGLRAYTSPAPDSPIRGVHRLRYVGKETVAVAVGRILGYRRMAGISKVATAALGPPASATSPPPAGTG